MLTAFALQKMNARKCLSVSCMRTLPVMLYVYHAACAAYHTCYMYASTCSQNRLHLLWSCLKNFTRNIPWCESHELYFNEHQLVNGY